MKDALSPWQPTCAEYFEKFTDGRYHEAGRHWFILAQLEILVDRCGKDLVIGSAGCDGIDFCFRQGLRGIWAYYPVEGDYVLVAANLKALEEGWLNGSISV